MSMQEMEQLCYVHLSASLNLLNELRFLKIVRFIDLNRICNQKKGHFQVKLQVAAIFLSIN